MAKDNKEIADIVKKCKILLLDVEGTTTSISFVKDKLFPYAEENLKQFLECEWENQDVKDAVNALRKLAIEDKEKSVEGLVSIPGEDASKEDQIEGLVSNVKWQMSSDRKVGPLKQLQGLIWKQGYDKGDIKGHVYDDVCSALEQWHSVEGQKVYIYSSGSVQAQKLLFGQSLVGDLLKYIDGHFDTAVGGKNESTSYTSIAEKVGCSAEEILFLTDIVKEAEAAKSAGLNVALVSREGNAPLTSEATDVFPVIHSLAQLSSNKRKTEPQDEQPAKVPKTDVSDDVKTATESQSTAEKTAPQKKEENDVPERMDVEEERQPAKDVTTEEKMVEETPVAEDSKGGDVVESETKPVISEVIENKNEKKEEQEVMETDSTEKIENTADKTQIENGEKEKTESIVTTRESNESIQTKQKTENEVSDVPKENTEVTKGDDGTPIVEETPPTVITEIEEITDKDNLTDIGEVIDDIEPIIEEPNPSGDIEELQNVGEVLEKECDEILSKVQDVTNLDNIPLKPLLNPIVEESMETDNIDSNDIVEGILETELELELKNQNSITEKITENIAGIDEKKDVVEEKKENTTEEKDSKEVKEKANVSETNSVPEEKAVESELEAEVTPEKTDIKSSPQENKPLKDNEEKLVTVSENNAESSSEGKSKDVTAETKVDAKEEEKSKEVTTGETQVNGKTNGETEPVNQNGDAKDEELSSRLSVENVKEVNGSNGDAMETENGQGDKTVEVEISDIKVKTVTTEEVRTELIEQPTEA